MARCTCILIVCLSIICRSYSAQKKWTGVNGATWDNQANWYPAGSPNDTDDVILDNTFLQSAYTVTLPGTQVSIHSLLIQPGQNGRIELVLPASNITSPALYVTSSLQSIVIRNGGVVRNSSGLNGNASVRINGMLSIYNGGRYIHNTRSSHATELVAKLSVASGTENGTFEFDVPGGSYPISLSNRTYGNLVLSSVSSGESQTYNASGSNICLISGDLLINNGVIFNLDFTRDLVVNGRYIQKGGTFNLASQLNYNVVKLKGAILQEAPGVITETMGWPVIEMAGTINQHVSFAGVITNDVAIRINNPAGVTLLTNMAVPFRFQFLNGIVKTSGASLLIFQHKSTVSGANGMSYIDGPLVKRGNGDFEFPTGKQGDYAPVKISAPGGAVTDECIAEYFTGNPRSTFGPAFQSPPIVRISALEYWIVKRVAGQVPGKITLSVGTYSHATALSDLVVARWDTAGSTWKSEGNFMSSGISTGLITSNNVSSFGAFTIGSTVQHQNPLPVSFIHLREVRTVNGITLLWETAEGFGQGYFDIERSDEGNHFRDVERINAKQCRQYTYNHTEGVSKDHFVRVRWVPKNGGHVYSNAIYVKGFTPAFEVVKIYPSIIIDAATMIISSEGNEEVHFCIRDINGKTVISQRHFLHKGKNVISVAARSLQVGIYFLTIRNNAGRTRVIRFFKT